MPQSPVRLIFLITYVSSLLRKYPCSLYSTTRGAEVPHNGEINETIGVYRALCCGAELVVKARAAFPDCPNHPRLTTIWKPVRYEKFSSAKADVGRPNFVPLTHVENRRLFAMAAGTIALETSERDHVHGCKVCQGVLLVFLRQQPGITAAGPDAGRDAA